MKCLYYLTSTLDNTSKITDDLHQSGINDWYIHVLHKNEAKLVKNKIHSSNYLERLDILRFGIIGAAGGFVVGIIAAILLNTTELFGSDLPNSAYFAIMMFFTLFGTWEGGLIGVATENKKITLFHEDLEAGKYLIIIYAQKAHEESVKKLMESQHPEATLAAVDANFYNPLVGLKRI